MKADKNGLHIIAANKSVDNYCVYHLMDGDKFIGAAYGPAAVLTLGLLAERFNTSEYVLGHTASNQFNGLDWLLVEF